MMSDDFYLRFHFDCNLRLRFFLLQQQQVSLLLLESKLPTGRNTVVELTTTSSSTTATQQCTVQPLCSSHPRTLGGTLRGVNPVNQISPDLAFPRLCWLCARCCMNLCQPVVCLAIIIGIFKPILTILGEFEFEMNDLVVCGRGSS